MAQPVGEPWLTAEQLVDRMNRWGIGEAVLLPLDSPEASPGVIYPTGPVEPGGIANRLLSEAHNVYADLSAQSAYNALTRDPDFTPGFLERN